MSQDVFGAFGTTADEVSENPYSITKSNVYNCMVSEAEVKEFNEIPYFVIEYTITDGEFEGKSANQMHRLIPYTDEERAERGKQDAKAMNARTLSGYKKSLLDLGVPAGAIGQFNPHTHGGKLVGIKGTAYMGPQKNNPEYNQISNFTRKQGANSDASAPAQNSAPVESQKKEETSGPDLDSLSNW